MSPQPWTKEKRSITKRKIDKEAERAAARLGASMVTILAWFPAGGEYLHMQDGGSAPMPSDALYKHLATVATILDKSGGEDVALS